MNEQATSRYASMSREQLISANEAKDATLQAIYQTIHEPNSRLAPGEKIALIASRCILPQEKPNSKGLVRYPTEKVAAFIGMSDGSAGRYANTVIERFEATKESEPYVTKKGQKRTLTYVDPTENIWTRPWEAELPSDKERVINGNGKRCPICNTDNLKVTTRRNTYQEIRDCDCCGYHKVSEVLDDLPPLEPVEFIPQRIDHQAEEPFAEKAPQPEEPFDNEPDYEFEKGLQAEDLFAEKEEKSEALTSYTQVVVQILEPPAELQSLKQWVVWKYKVDPEKPDGKLKKVPYQTRGWNTQKAMPNDPATWSTYDVAKKRYEDSRSWKNPYDGIGFVFANGYTGIDLDGCIKDGQITEREWARIQAISSYSELSPSGTGVHVIAKGTIPAGRKLPDIEMYCSGRFFTWTGQHITDTPATIEPRQEELTALFEEITPEPEIKEEWPASHPCAYEKACTRTDDEILAKARSNSVTGDLFRRLYDNGDFTGFPSQSEADFKLCYMLAFWTDCNVDAMHRLFQASKLMRPKWTRKAKGETTYGELTIENAILAQEGVA